MSVDVVTFGCRLNITESEAIRTEQAGMNASRVSALPQVRTALTLPRAAGFQPGARAACATST